MQHFKISIIFGCREICHVSFNLRRVKNWYICNEHLHELFADVNNLYYFLTDCSKVRKIFHICDVFVPMRTILKTFDLSHLWGILRNL